MKIALAQTNPKIGDFEGNTQKILEFIEKAKEKKADLVVFPELSICGYPPRDLLTRQEFLKAAEKAFSKIKAQIKGITAVIGLPRARKKSSHPPFENQAVVIADGEEVLNYAKNLLPPYDIFDEPRYFSPRYETACFLLKGRSIGLSVCEDIWHHRDFLAFDYDFDPLEGLAGRIEVLINISASPYYVGKIEVRKRLLSAQARRLGCYVFYCNQVGANDHLIFDGQSLVFSPEGELIGEACDFEEDLLLIDLGDPTPVGHQVSTRREESLLKALVFGVKEYFRKTGFKGALIGLSGGIDSSVTAAIATFALGAENVLGVLMPSPYTSQESNEDALALAQNLGIKTITIPITDTFMALRGELAKAFGREPKTLTQENLQARIRGNILMALANEFGCLVLNTGNKSEIAVGYCTLYGDTCGAISVLGDVLKNDVYALAREINRKGEIIPERVLIKPPSAELRPDQKDEDDLPPYRILNPIVKAFVEEGKSAEEIIAQGFPPEVVKEVLKRIRVEEYKRWQLPPTLRVSPRAFGYGWRYPIAQGFRFEG
ncbi:NAD+ synthase [Thermodesulfatator atlanticus]